MKKIAFFGGSGGLGSQVIKELKNYNISSISSQYVDVTNKNVLLGHI